MLEVFDCVIDRLVRGDERFVGESFDEGFFAGFKLSGDFSEDGFGLGGEGERADTAVALVHVLFEIAFLDVGEDGFGEGCGRDAESAGDFGLRGAFSGGLDSGEELEGAPADAELAETRFQIVCLEVVKDADFDAEGF